MWETLSCPQLLWNRLQDPEKYKGAAGYKEAFLEGVMEYNDYGYAKMNSKYQVEEKEALELFGFKVSCH